MSFFLPLLLAGALAAPVASSNLSVDDKNPRPRRVVIDTAVNRQLAADLVARARTAGENGSLQEARAQLLVATTMLREAGGLQENAVYQLVYIDFALDRYEEAANVLNELSDEAMRKGNITLAARSAADAAELYELAGFRMQAIASVKRVRSLLNDYRIPPSDRMELRKRLG